MNNKLVMSAVGVAIGVILLSTVLVPIISDAQHSNDVVYRNNNPYGIGSIYEFDETTAETIVITICNATERTVSINGEVVQTAAYQPVFISDVCSIRFYQNNMNFASLEGSRTITEATITINGGVATFNVLNGSTPIDISAKPITWAFIHNVGGDYIAVSNDSPTGFNWYSYKDGIYSANWITTTQEFFSIHGGEVKLTGSNGSRTVPLDWNGEDLGNGVFKMHLNNNATSDYTFTVDNGGEPYTVSPFLVCVPMEVVGYSPGSFSILSVIPVLIIVALMVSVIRIYSNRNE